MGGTSGMTCKTCRHPGRDDIDQALVSGEPHRSIAEQYGLSESSVFRHQENHLPATLVKAVEAKDEAHGIRLLDQAQGLVDEALASMERSKAAGREKDVLGGIREARHSVELTGRITGELRESRDAAPESALDAIIKLANALSDAELRGMPAGEILGATIIDGEGHVVEPEVEEHRAFYPVKN